MYENRIFKRQESILKNTKNKPIIPKITINYLIMPKNISLVLRTVQILFCSHPQLKFKFMRKIKNCCE